MAKAQAATAATQTGSRPGTTTDISKGESNSKDLSAGASSPVTASASSGLTQGQESDADSTAIEERIRARAYLLWEQRGCPIGEAELDWLHAEQELRGTGDTSAQRG
jgi:DUF2934 family protein